jgi:hypothetical protein
LAGGLYPLIGPPEGGPYVPIGPPEGGPYVPIGPPEGGPYVRRDNPYVLSGRRGRLQPARVSSCALPTDRVDEQRPERLVLVDALVVAERDVDDARVGMTGDPDRRVRRLNFTLGDVSASTSIGDVPGETLSGSGLT